MNLDTRSGPGMTCVYPDGGRDTVLLGGVPMAVGFPFGVWLTGGWWFYLWRWWLELRVVVLGISKGRGFAASFSSTTPKPPLKGALVAGAPSRGIAEGSGIFYYGPYRISF